LTVDPPGARLAAIVSTHDGDSTQTSRMRLLNAGRTLFAKNGYEQTSTAAIARESGSSESQLIRYFGGKAGLLEAIFNESWSRLNEMVQQHIDASAHGREAIIRILSLMIQAFSRDHDIAFLFLFEGRRMRGATHEVYLSKGFMQFMQVINTLIERGRDDGSFRTDIDPRVLSSAMLGCAEGMIRDRILAERNNLPTSPFDDQAILTTFTAMVNGLAP
jgi:AcrR family transcriptional regulator